MVLVLLTSGAPEPKEVMLSILGASAGVGGLVLVFLGVLITTVTSYPGATSDVVLRPYRRGAWAAVGVFGASLLTVATSASWLALSDARWIYVVTLALFGGLLLALFLLAAGVTRATV